MVTLWPDIPIDRAHRPMRMNEIANRTVTKPTTIAGKKIAEKPTPNMNSPNTIASALVHPDILDV